MSVGIRAVREWEEVIENYFGSTVKSLCLRLVLTSEAIMDIKIHIHYKMPLSFWELMK